MGIGPLIRKAKFGGAKFLVSDATVTEGRKTVTHEYLNGIGAAGRYVEDLGYSPRKFEMTAYISGDRRIYDRDKKKLIKALTTPGPQILVHPFIGNVGDVVALPYTLVERMGAVGYAEFKLRFLEAGNKSADVKGFTIAGALDSALAAIDEIAAYYDTVNDIAENIADAIDAVTAIGDAILDSILQVAKGPILITGALDRLQNSVLAGKESLKTLEAYKNHVRYYGDAQKWASQSAASPEDQLTIQQKSIANTPTVSASLSYSNQNGDTPARKAQLTAQTNAIVANKAMALAGAYAAASRINYKSSDQLAEVSSWLSAKIDELAPDMPQEVLAALDGVKGGFLAKAASLRTKLPALTDVEVNNESLTLVSYRYYGSIAPADSLAKLNDPNNTSAVTGLIKIIGRV